MQDIGREKKEKKKERNEKEKRKKKERNKKKKRKAKKREEGAGAWAVPPAWPRPEAPAMVPPMVPGARRAAQ